MKEIYCRHYLLPNKSLLKDPDFYKFFKNLKYKYILDNDHICLNIRDSIHYKILTKEVPWNLYNKYITLTIQPEHSVEIYQNLIKNFNFEKVGLIKINNNIIVDGTHRAAIITFINQNVEKYILYL